MTLTLGMEKRMKGWPGEPQMEYDVRLDGVIDTMMNGEPTMISV